MYKVTGYFKDNKVTRSFTDVYDAIDFRDIVDNRRYADLGVHPSGDAFRKLPKELKQSIPFYIKQNVNLQRLENVR